MNLEQHERAVRRSADRFARASEDLRDRLARLRPICKHTDLLECSAYTGPAGGYFSEHRLCLTCGAEEYDSPGWQVLRGPAATVSREHLYRLRPPFGSYRVTWCYGNREHAGHQASYPLSHNDGTRCCAEHALPPRELSS